MKRILILSLFILSSNCSLNKDSKYWTEDYTKNKNDQKKISILSMKSYDITAMTQEEYKIYIDDLTKKSKYPDITQ